MNSSQWSAYNTTYLNGGLQHLPPPIVHEDHLNNYDDVSSSSMHLPSCHNGPVLSSTRANPDPSVTSLLANTTYECIISPKEATECVFKDGKDGSSSYAQMSSSLHQNDGNNFHSPKNGSYVGPVTKNGNFTGQVTKNGNYAGQVTKNGSYAGQVAKNGNYAGQVAENGNYAGQVTENGNYAGQVTENGNYAGQVTENGNYAGQVTENGNYAGQVTENGNYAGQVTENGNYTGQVTENGNYAGQLPSISYHSPPVDQPSPGPFGVLPHESVMTQMGRYERKNESFISPSPKTNASFNNGPYADNTNIYSSAPLSVQSAYSGDTASLSPAAASVTSSYSPSSDLHESPKNYGAYTNLQSPMAQNPVVTTSNGSLPSSPGTSVNATSSSRNVTYVNNLICAPARNGQNTQQSPSSNAASNVLCFKTPQSQNMAHHGSQSMLPKTDFNSDFSVFGPDQNSGVTFNSSYCPPIRQAQLSNGTNTRHSPRTHAYPNSVPHEGRLHYGHVSSLPSATISSSNYLQSKVSHETPYGSCSSSIPPGQSMHPPKYLHNSSLSSHVNAINPVQSSVMSNHIMNDRSYGFSSSNIVDDKGALDLFNSHVDSGAHDQEVINPMSHFIENNLNFLTSETTTNRQLRSKVSDYNSNHSPNIGNSHRNMIHQPTVLNEHLNSGLLTPNAKYSYSSSLDQGHPGNLSNIPRKRGRRGRRRKAEVNGGRWRRSPIPRREYSIFNNRASLFAGNMHELDSTGYYKSPSRSLNENVLPPPSLTHSLFHPKSDPKPFLSTDKLEYKDICNFNNKRKSINQKREDYGPYNTKHVLREILPFINHTAPIRRKTRNTDKRESLYQTSYINFVRGRRVFPGAQWPPHDQEVEIRKEKTLKYPKIKREPDLDPLKLKIKMDPHKPDKWYCCRGSYDFPVNLSDDESTEESDSSSSEILTFSGQNIKKEINSEDESRDRYAGNLSKVTEKTSAKGKNNDKSYDYKEKHLNYPNNSKNFLLGKTKVEKTSASFNSDEQHNTPKKSGRKTKITPSPESETNTKARKTSLKSIDSKTNSSAFIKKEVVEEDEASSERLRSLRRRRNESISKEPEPGPSVQEEEPPDFSSDHYEHFDDTDSDPAWTPSCKSSKAVDSAKNLVGQFPKKRGPKTGRRRSLSNNPTSKRKKGNQKDSHSKKRCSVKLETSAIKKDATDNSSKMKKDIECDRFLVAKADINLPTPFIWKVDKKSSMLQRFEISEQNGVLLYHSSFTYAARNEISVNNYVTADVRIKSPDTVQYLGPNLSEAAAVALSKMKSAEVSTKTPVKENFNHLREDFTVYLQCLLSQDVDSSFLCEIKKFKDDYFLVPITKLETISENKKQKLMKDSWNEDLRNCVNNFPCFSIINNITENAHCLVCEINLGNKLLQFFGQPYDLLTLEPVDTLSANKTEFDVCDKCCSSLSLYNRLHHHRYNLFTNCHSKASEIKSKHENLKSHEDVLKLCLEDIAWIDKLFKEQIQMWHDVEEKS
ncbi:DUF4211 domain-containing protein [Trichonephila clavata]|uniref:DUF4211 domain-containing protein n=1 Tax=Trichonephila clavata TaxID=2740835 RepID=A0A8X6F5M1_TRICU|nr:DUF4211 domain-containing protein [Trichonephila clavata]